MKTKTIITLSAVGLLIVFAIGQHLYYRHELQDMRKLNNRYTLEVGEYKIKNAMLQRKIKVKDDELADLIKDSSMKAEKILEITQPERLETGKRKEDRVVYTFGELDLKTLDFKLNEKTLELVLTDDGKVISNKTWK